MQRTEIPIKTEKSINRKWEQKSELQEIKKMLAEEPCLAHYVKQTATEDRYYRRYYCLLGTKTDAKWPVI